MGIKNISDILKQGSFHYVPLNKYRYKKIAIDISPYLFKFKIVHQDKWLHSFVNLICALRRNNVHAVFIYDGKAPVEKKAEQESRMHKKKDRRDKAELLRCALQKYEIEGVIDPVLLNLKQVKLLDDCIDKEAVLQLIDKYDKQTVNITREDRNNSKELLTKLGVPYIEAPGEAEKYACELFHSGFVSAVMSEDSDVLVFGATMLSKIDMKTDTILEIRHDDLLAQYNLSERSWVDLCIMLGTDFNKNIYGIGPVKALNLIKQHGDIDEIAKQTKIDVSPLNHIRVRQLYVSDVINKSLVIPYCKKPDLRDLNNYDINLISQNMCSECNITFVD